MHAVVNGVILRNGSVLLGKRCHGRRIYPDCWALPGGHVEQGETLEDALIREIREEIGLTPTDFRELGLIAELDPETDSETIYHIYVVTTWQGGDPVMLGNEHSELHWFELEAACGLPDLAIAGYKPLFRSVLPTCEN